MRFRRTLRKPAVVEGIALHTGDRVRARLAPAGGGTGIVFVRTDAGGSEIPALLENVGPSFYATVLERDGVTVSTIEHLMAALYALQVDDLRVEIDGPELPILDGSSKPWVDAILEAEPVELPELRLYMNVIRPIEVSHEEKRISVHPAPHYRVTYAIEFDDPVLGYQELTATLWGDASFPEKLAPARTFTFEKDVRRLRERGLARGGSLENAVVVGERGILNADLRFPDEFVRHKMLDLTGDLALLGHPLRGHVIAFRAGHDLHARLVRKIRDARDCWYLAPWTEDPAGKETAAG